jgi:CheY-like chemotaxis protein
MSETPVTITVRSSPPEQGSALDAGPDAATGCHPPTRPSFTALIVEDNMLIAMDAEEALQELGAGAVKLCPTVASALDSIAAAPFDVALLDVSLGEETSEAIAVALRAHGTPFVVTTGFGDYISDISAYAGAPLLTKPYAPAALSHALDQVMG